MRTLLAAAPVGPELLLSEGSHLSPATALEADGDFVVTWTTPLPNNGSAIYGQRFSAGGVPAGESFRITENQLPHEDHSAVAVDADGDFVVTWVAPQGASDAGVYARRFNAAGEAHGQAFFVGEYHGGFDSDPDVAMSAAGEFVIVWRDLEAVGRLYDPTGQALGGEFVLSAEPFPPDSSDFRGDFNPAVAMEPDGDFVVAWQRDAGPMERRILARRFDAGGTGIGGNVAVAEPLRNDDTSSHGPGPDVGVDADGDFLVTWQSYDGGSYGIYGRRFTSAAQAQTDPFVVSSYGEDGAVAMDAAGTAMIVWSDYYTATTFARQYAPAGNAVGGTMSVNTSPSGFPAAAVAANAAGQLVVAWAGSFENPGVFAQQFSPVANEASVGNFVWEDADADGVWDRDEPGLNDVTVKLFNAQGAPVGTTKTVGGHYRFDHLRPEEQYTLEVVLPEGMLLTARDAGTNDYVDNDFSHENGRVAFTLAPHEVDLSIDVGLIRQATISGFKFSDTDGDGLRDAHEPRLSGWVIYVDANSNAQLDAGENSDVTDATGAYTLAGIRPGTYTIREMPQLFWSGVAPSGGSHSVPVAAGDQRAGVDFANRTNVPTLFVGPRGPEGRVEIDASAGNYEPAVAIDEDGNYVVAWMASNSEIGGFDVLARRFHSSGDPLGGPFMVHTAAAGNQQNPSIAMTPDGSFVVAWESLPTTNSRTRIEARVFSATGMPLSGDIVVSPETGRDHADAEVAIDHAGNFVVAWDTNVQSQQEGEVYARLFDAAGAPRGSAFVVDELYTYSMGDASVAMDASGDFIVSWFNTSNPSRVGIQARRYDAAGNPVGAVLNVHNPISYGTPHDLAMDDEGNFVLYAEGTAHRFDAEGRRLSAPIKVGDTRGGVVSMDDGGGFVVFSPGEFQDTITVRRFNAAGAYTASALRYPQRPSGRHAVAMNGAGDFVTVWSAPNDLCCTSSVYAQRWHDVTPGTVTGVVWEDLDADGIRDENETGVDGVKLALADANGMALLTTRTRDGGQYHFDAIPGMTYTLWADPPSAALFTRANQGTDDTRDSDVNPNTRLVPAFMLTPGQSSQHNDFGYIRGSSIAGIVFDDADADGVQDADEKGVDGWTVYVDADADDQLDAGEPSVHTSNGGYYHFWSLTPGTYRVRQLLQSGWTQTLPATEGHDVLLQSAQHDTDNAFGNTTDFVPCPLTRAGGAIPVSTHEQAFTSSTASDDKGNFVVVWNEILPTHIHQVWARLYTADGTPRGAAFPVSTDTANQQLVPDVAMDGQGRFVVVWGADQGPQWGYNIAARRFAADGTAQGTPFVLNTLRAGHQFEPAIDMDRQGNFVVTWQSFTDSNDSDVYARRINAAGEPVGTEFLVNSVTANNQRYADVAVDEEGGFVVTFESEHPADPGVFARRYQNGAPIGAAFRVNEPPLTGYAGSQVASDDDGDFVVVWTSNDDGSGHGIMARRYTSDGLAEGGPFRVNVETIGNQQNSSVAMDDEENFVVVWNSDGLGANDNGVHARYYTAANTSLAPLQVNRATGVGSSTGVTVTPEGFVVVWDEPVEQASQVFAQRFTFTDDPVTVTLTPNRAAPDTPVDSVQIVFNRPVGNFDLGDITINNNPLPSGATLTTADSTTFTLGNLSGSTFAVGIYTLRIVGNDIVDADGGGFEPGASLTFTQSEIVITGTPGDDKYYLRLAPDGYRIQLFDHVPTDDSTPIYTPEPYGGSFRLRTLGGNDTLVVDAASGDPYGATSVLFDGGDGNDTLILSGSVNEDAFTIGDSVASVGRFEAAREGVEFVELRGRGGDDSFAIEDDPNAQLKIDTGAGESTVTESDGDHTFTSANLLADRLHLVVADDATVTIPDARNLRSLDLSRAAKIFLTGDAGQVFRLNGLSITHDATLDIGSATVVVEPDPDNRAVSTNLAGLVRSGRLTSADASRPNRDIAVGEGASVKSTWTGDANLDGRINSDDYFRIDSGFLAQPANPAYNQGDFNYDGRINSDDYFLIDSAFLAQGTQAGTGTAAVATRGPVASDELPSLTQKRRRAARTPFAVDRLIRRRA